MHRFPENMFIHSPRQDHFSNQTIKLLDPSPPFLYLKKSDIFSQIQQKRPSQTPVVTPFRDTYAMTSKNMFLLRLRQGHFCN